MKFTCEIDMDNDAFQDENGRELGRILRKIATFAEDAGSIISIEYTVRDYNGNKVGLWKVEP